MVLAITTAGLVLAIFGLICTTLAAGHETRLEPLSFARRLRARRGSHEQPGIVLEPPQTRRDRHLPSRQQGLPAALPERI